MFTKLSYEPSTFYLFQDDKKSRIHSSRFDCKEASERLMLRA